MSAPGPNTLSFTSVRSSQVRQLMNDVFAGPHFNPASPPASPQACGAQRYRAIWDTGATGSVITPAVVAACGLQPISVAWVTGVNGTRQAQVYLVSLWLPNHVSIPAVRVTANPITGANILIGMDVIGRGNFAVSQMDSKMLFSFRVPCVEMIDFVKQSNRTVLKNGRPVKSVDRNDPCPCGSGKKFKQCCGS